MKPCFSLTCFLFIPFGHRSSFGSFPVPWICGSSALGKCGCRGGPIPPCFPGYNDPLPCRSWSWKLIWGQYLRSPRSHGYRPHTRPTAFFSYGYRPYTSSRTAIRWRSLGPWAQGRPSWFGWGFPCLVRGYKVNTTLNRNPSTVGFGPFRTPLLRRHAAQHRHCCTLCRRAGSLDEDWRRRGLQHLPHLQQPHRLLGSERGNHQTNRHAHRLSTWIPLFAVQGCQLLHRRCSQQVSENAISGMQGKQTGRSTASTPMDKPLPSNSSRIGNNAQVKASN